MTMLLRDHSNFMVDRYNVTIMAGAASPFRAHAPANRAEPSCPWRLPPAHAPPVSQQSCIANAPVATSAALVLLLQFGAQCWRLHA